MVKKSPQYVLLCMMCQIVWLPLVIAFLKSGQSEAVIRIIDNTMVKRKKHKHTIHGQQNSTQKTKDRPTQNLLKAGFELRCSDSVISSCSTSCTHSVILFKNPVISHCIFSCTISICLHTVFIYMCP